MMQFVLYQVKVAVCIALFTGMYVLLFRSNTFHRLNRFYLLAAMIVSTVLPLIHLAPLQGGTEILPAVINTVTIVADRVSGTRMHGDFVIDFLTWIYPAISLVFALYLLFQLGTLLLLISQNRILAAKGYKIILLSNGTHSFSFFNLIFLHPAVQVNEHHNQVICHELLHVKQGHSLDILCVQMLKIFQWFNPFIYLLERSLKETHEYLADKAVLEQDSRPDEYGLLLLAQVFGVQPGIFSFFNHSLLKNRLHMMTKQNSPPRNKLIYITTLPLVFFLGMMMCCTHEKPQPLPDPGATGLKNTPSVNEPAETEDPAYVYVEKQAGFQDGDVGTFRDWVQQHVVYPPEALKNGIFGRITLEFAVSAKGKVVDIKVLRSVDPILEKAAVMALASSPDWIPAENAGRKVKQLFVIPVDFELK
jgi:TonB family protein